MNRDFKSKFDEMQNDLSKSPVDKEDERFFLSPSNARFICFAWADGRMQSFNYAYLVNLEFLPEEPTVRLEFTTHSVVLKGYGLEPLYMEIFNQRARIVTAVDERYNDVEQEKTLVNEILVEPTK